MKHSALKLQPVGRLLPTAFRISYPEDPPQSLQESIRRVGILTPLLCLEGTEGVKILDGHRRYLAARALDMAWIPVSVLTDASPQDLVRVWLQAQLAVRSLNVFEIATLLAKSETCFNLPEEEMRQIVISESSLSVSSPLLVDFPGLLGLPEQFKREALTRRYSAAFLVRIIRLYPRSLLETVARLMMRVGFSENQLDLLLEWMNDIMERDGLSPTELTRSEAVSFVLSHPGMPSAKRRDALLKAVWTIRFPERARLQGLLRETQQKVASLGDARLVAPRDLMGDRFELRIGFRKADELHVLLERLLQLSGTIGEEIEQL